MEMEIPLKASYFLTHKVIVESNKKDLKEQIHAPGKACKGPEYNPVLSFGNDRECAGRLH